MFPKHRNDIETALKAISEEQVQRAIDLLQSARAQGVSVFILGNGGSAATSSHLANDLVKACGIKAYSLPDMTSMVTAFGNDHHWEEMYTRLLVRILSPTDVVIVISCSGNSPNIVDPVRMLKHFPRVRTLALIGADLDCDIAQERPYVVVSVPFRDIKVQEDCHMIICHAIVKALRDAPAKAQGVL